MVTTYIKIKEARFYAFHGVMPQERRVGGWFTVTLRVGYDWSRAAKTDDVGDTLNYADLYQLVDREMAVPSQLLEHVAGRIAQSILDVFSSISAVTVTVNKEHPPVDVPCESSGFTITAEK